MAQITLKNVRISFIQALWNPKPFKDSEPACSSTFLLPKGSLSLKEAEKAMLATAEARWPGKGKQIIAQITGNNNRCCLQDGDKTSYDGFEGQMSIRGKSKTRPTIINRDRSPVGEADGIIQSGDYVNAIIDFFGYDNPAKGVSAGLSGVQFVRKGEALSGGRAADPDAFEDLGEQGDDGLI